MLKANFYTFQDVTINILNTWSLLDLIVSLAVNPNYWDGGTSGIAYVTLLTFQFHVIYLCYTVTTTSKPYIYQVATSWQIKWSTITYTYYLYTAIVAAHTFWGSQLYNAIHIKAYFGGNFPGYLKNAIKFYDSMQNYSNSKLQ